MWVENLNSPITTEEFPSPIKWLCADRKGEFFILEKDNFYFIETVAEHVHIILKFYQLLYT